MEVENISKFIDVRLDAFKTHGSMYGCNEAVEMQAITLIEMEYFINSKSINYDPRKVINLYTKQVKKIYKECGNQPFLHIQSGQNIFYDELYDVRKLLK
jgi:hypothetical protein